MRIYCYFFKNELKLSCPGMTTEKINNLLDNTAKIVSIVFHPMLMHLYGMIIILSAPTLFGYLPFNVKKNLLFIVLVNNVLIPLSLMPYYKFRDIIKSWSIENSSERIIPLIITSIFYSLTAFLVFGFQIPLFLKSYLIASSFVVIGVTLINFLFKISIHSVGAGVLTALILILVLKTYSPLTGYLVSAILTGGLVLTSRLRLNKHTPRQVWIGFLTGFIGLIFIMLLL